MKGERHVIEVNGIIRLVGKQECVRLINKSIDVKYHGKIQGVKAKVSPPKKLKAKKNKDKILRLFVKNIDYIANKNKSNCYRNFKTLVFNNI